MQVFSFVVLAIILWITVSTKSSKDRFIKILILNIVLATHFESGYFFSAGGFELGYDQVTSVFTAFFGLLAIKGKFRKGIVRAGAFFYGSILVGVICLVLFPYGERIVTGSANNYDEVIEGLTELQYASFDSGTLSGLLFFGIFVLMLICAYQCLEYIDIEKIVIKVSGYFKWILIYGVVEAIFVYILRTNAHRVFINLVMGRGRSTFSDLIIRDNGFMLQGLTREASHYMFALFISMVVIMAAYYIQRKKATPWIIIFTVISLLSFSLSSVIYLLGVVLFNFLIIVRNDPDNARSITVKLGISIGVGLLFLIIVSIVIWNIRSSTDNYLLKRLGEAEEAFLFLISSDSISIFNNYYLRESSAIRLYSVIETFKLFLHRPLFGLGMGVVTCHGSTMMFLGDVGIIGLYSWYKFVNAFKKKVFLDAIGVKLCKLSMLLYLFINLLSSTYLVPFQSPVVLAYVLSTILAFNRNKRPIDA